MLPCYSIKKIGFNMFIICYKCNCGCRSSSIYRRNHKLSKNVSYCHVKISKSTVHNIGRLVK